MQNTPAFPYLTLYVLLTYCHLNLIFFILSFNLNELCVKVSTKAMVNSWLYDATMYELWIAIAGDLAHHIYFSDLPWPIGKILLWKKTYDVKKLLGVTNLNCEEREAEVIHLPPLSFHISFETLPEFASFYSQILLQLTLICQEISNLT